MKYVYWFLGLLVGIPVLLIAIPIAASELGGEVVTLERPEEAGEPSRIRIWIVDNEGASWIEHGDSDSYWMDHLQTSNEVILDRGGQTQSYEGTADPDSHDLYHDLRRQKYSWADQLIELFSGGRESCDGVPVRLQLSDDA
ncbi:MAG: hypothetical protein JKY86_11820 [Gammaproteobacteria bacterium]|nr:hypothetical protein [Gammaproteobacteria bacterium]